MLLRNSTPPNDSQCSSCSLKFSFINRRYTCRSCTSSFCFKHCNFFKRLPFNKSIKNVRVCEVCFRSTATSTSSTTITTTTSCPLTNVPLCISSLNNSLKSKITSTIKDKSPISIEKTKHSKNEGSFPILKKVIAVSSADDSHLALEIDVTTYNVWMMPDRVTKFARSVSPSKKERALRIALELPKSDIVVFSEAFCVTARMHLLSSMAQQGYIYRSPVVGRVEIGIRPLDGGVVLLSRHPIEVADIKKFGRVSVGDDRLADKGVLYCRIRKKNVPIHIFATHTQAWNSDKASATRMKQFSIIAEFIEAKMIPRNEPVIVTGDLNVDKWKDEINGEHRRMLATLQCNEPHLKDVHKHRYSFDGKINPLAASGLSSDGSQELLDYILYSTYHRQPKVAESWVSRIQATTPWANKKNGKVCLQRDLSDHFPVFSHFEF